MRRTLPVRLIRATSHGVSTPASSASKEVLSRWADRGEPGGLRYTCSIGQSTNALSAWKAQLDTLRQITPLAGRAITFAPRLVAGTLSAARGRKFAGVQVADAQLASKLVYVALISLLKDRKLPHAGFFRIGLDCPEWEAWPTQGLLECAPR